jgi:hypothetical protein
VIETIIVSLIIVLGFCVALGLGQFFGRAPIKAKCNPDACCMQSDDCDRVIGDGD